MEERISGRPSRTRRPPAGLSDYDTARENSADPEKFNTHAPQQRGKGLEEQAKSPKKRRVEQSSEVVQGGRSPSPRPASEGGEEWGEGANLEDKRERTSASEVEGSVAELSPLVQLPEDILAKILGSLPSNYLVQASGVSPPPLLPITQRGAHYR